LRRGALRKAFRVIWRRALAERRIDALNSRFTVITSALLLLISPPLPQSASRSIRMTRGIFGAVLVAAGCSAAANENVKALSADVNQTVVDKTIDGHRDGVFAVKAQPGGDLIATASRDKTVGLGRVGDRALKRLEGHTNQVLRVAFNSKGTMLASGGADNIAILWDVQSKKNMRTLKGHTNWVCDLCFDEPGERLVTAGADGTARIWNVADGKELASIKVPGGEVWTAVFARNGDVLTGGKDGTLRRWAIGQVQPKASEKGHASDLYTIALTKEGLPATVGADGKVVLWDEQLKVRASWQAHQGQAYSLAFLPDGRLATCGEDKTVRLWDTGSQREVWRGTVHKNAVYGLTVLADGRVASAGQDRVINIWANPLEGIAGQANRQALKAQ